MSCKKSTSSAGSFAMVFRLLVWLIVAGLVLAPTLRATAEPCGATLALPLDHPLKMATVGPVRFLVELATPSFLIVEAQSGSARSAPDVRWLDSECRPAGGGLAVREIRGRLVQRVAEAGTYVVEVAAVESFLLVAWSAESVEGKAGVAKREPMDESDELKATVSEPVPQDSPLPPGDPSREPMDESDDLRSGEMIRWQEVDGHGMLERTPQADGLGVRFHAWCPLLDRPELLATFTCARHLRWRDGVATLRPVLAGRGEVFAFTLPSSSWLAVEPGNAARIGKTRFGDTLFDVHGERVADLTDGRSVWLPAGDYFLRVRPSVDDQGLHLIAEGD